MRASLLIAVALCSAVWSSACGSPPDAFGKAVLTARNAASEEALKAFVLAKIGPPNAGSISPGMAYSPEETRKAMAALLKREASMLGGGKTPSASRQALNGRDVLKQNEFWAINPSAEVQRRDTVKLLKNTQEETSVQSKNEIGGSSALETSERQSHQCHLCCGWCVDAPTCWFVSFLHFHSFDEI